MGVKTSIPPPATFLAKYKIIMSRRSSISLSVTNTNVVNDNKDRRWKNGNRNKNKDESKPISPNRQPTFMVPICPKMHRKEKKEKMLSFISSLPIKTNDIEQQNQKGKTEIVTSTTKNSTFDSTATIYFKNDNAAKMHRRNSNNDDVN